MSVRLIALYAPPEDPAAFDAHYRDIHAPIVERYPGIRSLRLTRADGVAGRAPAFYLMAEMAFVGSSRVDLQACKLEYSIVSPK